MRWRPAGACLLAVLLSAEASWGYITRVYSLQEVLDESTHVVAGKVHSADAAKRTVVAVLGRVLKGKCRFKRIRMNLAVGPADHSRFLLKRMKPGARILFFYQRKGGNIACVGHVGGTWFQLFAADDPAARERVWWRFTHLEIYMGRTYRGPTAKLIELVGGVLSGRVKPPPPDPTVPKLDITRPPRLARRPPRVSPRPGGMFSRRIEIRGEGGREVRGLAWADVNGDERLDVLACRQRGNRLLINQSPRYPDLARRVGLAGGARSAAWADYNGDDHADLLTNDFRLYTNIGGRLRDDSVLLPAPRARNTEGAGWIDYNGDGRADVLITNGEHGIRLYENTGRGPKWFRDVSDRAGLGAKGLGRGNGDFIICFDYDADGFADFFYNLGPGLLAHNRGDGTFALARGCGIELPAGSSYKRGLAAGDYDNDGDMDLFVPGPKNARLYRNNGDGTFTDVFAASGDPPKESHPSFAAAWGDVNCDGKLDLFVCRTRGSSRLYLGDGRGRFADVSDAAGVRDLAPAYAAGLADLDDDGDLDLAVNLADRVVVAFNDFPRPKDHAPLTVRVHARRGLVGAVVRAFDVRGRPLGLRELSLPQGPGGQAPPIAHFALPLGTCRVSVCLSDGRAARKSVTIGAKAATIRFHEGDFK